MTRKVKRKRLNIKRTLVVVLILYILGNLGYELLNHNIVHIEVTGNNLISDAEIIRTSNLKDYPSMMKYSSKEIEENIKKIALVDKVKVKKWLNYTIKINIEENKILFYYKNTKKIALSNGKIIKNVYDNIYGVPIFVSDLKSDLMINFIKGYSEIDSNVISEIGEIEYFPKYGEENKVISDDCFKLLMNDGNTVIANSKTINGLNKYNTIYASLGDKKGTINLDSNKLSNLVFIPYEE